MRKMRVLSKFEANLVIPKAVFMVIFQPEEGICIKKGFISYFQYGKGKIKRDLHNKVRN